MNPFNNPFLSPSDVTGNHWRAQAASAFAGRPLITRLPLSAIEERLTVAKQELAAREDKADALRELVGNLAGANYLSPGCGGDVHDLAQRYDAEKAMAGHLRLAVEGLERLMHERQAANITREAA